MLFIEQFFAKISPENQDLINKLKKINFNQDDSTHDFCLMKLSKDKSIGEKLILTAGPSIGSREKVFALDAAANGWNNQWSKYLQKFEKKFETWF